MSLADRATIGNMAPEYGATCGIFPVDAETCATATDGPKRGADRAGGGLRQEQGWFHTADSPEAEYTQTTHWTWQRWSPALPARAGPRTGYCFRNGASFEQQLPTLLGPSAAGRKERQTVRWEGEGGTPGRWHRKSSENAPAHGQGALRDRCRPVSGSWVHCDRGHYELTNTSNPSVMMAAGLLAKKAVEKGLKSAALGKDFAGPGLARGDGVLPERWAASLDKLRFHVVGYGCTTCIGNSGPLPTDVSYAIEDHSLVAVSVLSGNRNFEGRINSEVRANYLMSPPLVVAYALAGRIEHNFTTTDGQGSKGKPVYLKTSGQRRKK